MELTSQATSMALMAAQRITSSLSDAQYFESRMVPEEEILRQLDSSSSKEKLVAMKRILALISLGRDASRYFPSVVKNVLADSFDVQKLVYLYLVHYAEEQEELALLSINAFQKDLDNPNQIIRALALRVLSSIRVKLVHEIILLAIKKSARDQSAYVRNTAAHAIPKLAALDPDSREELLEPLELLLNDRVASVLGSAVAAWQAVVPERTDLLHPHFRRLCRVLVDLDEWSQVVVMDVLQDYCRNELSQMRAPAQKTERPMILFDADPEPEEELAEPKDLDPDVDLALRSIVPLLRCRAPAVVMAAVSFFHYIAPERIFINMAVRPLVRIIHSRREIGFVGLAVCVQVAARFPEALVPYLSEFFLNDADGQPVQELKAKVLLVLAGSFPKIERQTRVSASALLRELSVYMYKPVPDIACIAARAVCLLSYDEDHSARCIKLLSGVIRVSPSEPVVSEAVRGIRHILGKEAVSHASNIRDLGKLICEGKVEMPTARAGILGILGDFIDLAFDIGLECLRVGLKNFSKESPEVKIQTMNLALKASLKVSEDSVIRRKGSSISARTFLSHATQYVLELARYDMDWDVRDRCRILQTTSSEESAAIGSQVEAVLSSPKPESNARTVSHFVYPHGFEDGTVKLGSMLHLTGMEISKRDRVLSWTSQPTDPSVRGDPSSMDGVGTQPTYEPAPVSQQLVRAEYRPSQPVLSLEEFYDDSGDGSIGDEDASFAEETDEDRGEEDDEQNEEEDEMESEGAFSEEEVDDEGDRANVRSQAQGVTILDRKGVANDLMKEGGRGKSAKNGDSAVELDGSLSAIDIFLGMSSSNSHGLSKPDSNRRGSFLEALSEAFQSSTDEQARIHLRWRRALESWRGHGLEVDFAVSHTVNVSKDCRSVFLRLFNRSNHHMRDIVIKRGTTGLEDDVPELEGFCAVDELESNASSEVSSVVCFGGHEKPCIPLVISLKVPSMAMDGAFIDVEVSLEIRPNVGDLSQPEAITLESFIASEKQLRGLFTHEVEFRMPRRATSFANPEAAGHYWHTEGKRMILDVVNAAVITPPIGSSFAEEPLRLSTRITGSHVCALISFRVAYAAMTDDPVATLKVSCQDALIGANLAQLLKMHCTT